MERLNNSTYVGQKTNRIRYEIGDSKQPASYPQFKTIHFDNECNFSLRLKEDSYDGLLSQKNGKVEYIQGNKTSRFYEKQTDDEDGGFEFEVEFAEKPASNVVEFSIQMKGLVAVYQGEYTKAEQKLAKQLGITLNPRESPVLGSYVFFHDSKRGNEYKSGKVFHIPRPFIEDSSGKKVWCDMLIKGDSLKITVPQQFLDTAVYPVILDPAVGYTSIGGSTFTIGNDYTACKFTSTAAQTITSIVAYLRKSVGSGTENCRCAVYDDTTGALMLRTSDTAVGTTAAWSTFAGFTVLTTANLTSTQVHRLCPWSAGATVDFYFDSGLISQLGVTTNNPSPFNWNNPLGSLTNFDFVVSIYSNTTLIGTIATPGVGTDNIAGFPPTISITNNKNVSPGNGPLAVQGYSSTVTATNNISLVPGPGTISMSGIAPAISISNNIAAFPSSGPGVLAGTAPSLSISNHISVVPGAGTTQCTGFAPAVEASNNQIVSPGMATLSNDGFTPVVNASDNINITTSNGDIAYTGFVPTIHINNNVLVQPGKGGILLNGVAPVVSVSNNTDRSTSSTFVIYPLTAGESTFMLYPLVAKSSIFVVSQQAGSSEATF